MDDQERVDIVNEDNQILYSTSKTEAHKKNLLHRTIISEVINNEGKMLLVKQASHKQDVGQYVSPVGGHIRSGETEFQALEREAMEEIGLKNFSYKRVGQAIYNRFVLNHHENHFFIVYEIFSNVLPTLNDESDGYKYFTQEEITLALVKNPEVFGAAFHFVIDHFYPDLRK